MAVSLYELLTYTHEELEERQRTMTWQERREAERVALTERERQRRTADKGEPTAHELSN